MDTAKHNQIVVTMLLGIIISPVSGVKNQLAEGFRQY